MPRTNSCQRPPLVASTRIAIFPQPLRGSAPLMHVATCRAEAVPSHPNSQISRSPLCKRGNARGLWRFLLTALSPFQFFGNGALGDLDLDLVCDLENQGRVLDPRYHSVDPGGRDHFVTILERGNHGLQLLLPLSHRHEDEEVEDNADYENGRKLN